ncbi:MAG: S8 family serine peptidase [Ktedonobacterales bacterium]
MRNIKRTMILTVTSLALVAVALSAFVAVPTANAQSKPGSYIVVYNEGARVDTSTVRAHGHKITHDLSRAGVLVVDSTNPRDLASLPGVAGVTTDQIRIKTPKEDLARIDRSQLSPCAVTPTACGYQWDLARINVPQAWQTTHGSASVKVAVLDTGLTSTHEEVGSNYDKAESASFVQPNSICPQDATTFGSIEDFQGHGTWTNTHVAGVTGRFMTGIAPRTTLINIRVLGACGFGLDSWILTGMLYANSVGARVESMSLGGYLCAFGVVPGSAYCPNSTMVGTDPVTYKAYVQVVKYLARHGTLVVAAAGNEHANLGSGGRVLNHSTLAFGSPSPNPANDLFGLAEVPGGVPGVIAVSAVNRLTWPAQNATDTKFGQYGVGREDQLTYYSSYGSRVDVSAPGGSRRFNVPLFDCNASSTCGNLDPTSSAFDNTGDFGAWGVNPDGTPCNNCYVDIQGTSMATPQVTGVAALALAAHPHLSAVGLRALLWESVSNFRGRNATPPTADNPSDPQYNYDIDYDLHAISNGLMGTGVIDAAKAVR